MSAGRADSFGSIGEAAFAFLLRTTDLLASASNSWIIVGGWGPVLRGVQTDKLRHPGTVDVDVLFGGNRAEMAKSVEVLLKAGYVSSAKHAFQLLDKVFVGDREFIFNVDFLHPEESRANPEMFVDIVDLGVVDELDPTGKRFAKSIIFPSARLIFNNNFWSQFEVPSRGHAGKITLPLIDEVGLILSKSESVKNKKRTRDSFDIFFTLAQPNGKDTARRFRESMEMDDSVAEQARALRWYLENRSDDFDLNVAKYCENHLGPDSPARFVRTELFD